MIADVYMYVSIREIALAPIQRERPQSPSCVPKQLADRSTAAAKRWSPSTHRRGRPPAGGTPGSKTHCQQAVDFRASISLARTRSQVKPLHAVCHTARARVPGSLYNQDPVSQQKKRRQRVPRFGASLLSFRNHSQCETPKRSLGRQSRLTRSGVV